MRREALLRPWGEGHAPGSFLLGAVVAAEAAILLFLLPGASLLPAIGIALGGLFFLLAFRAPEGAWMAILAAVPFSWEALLPGGSAIAVPTEPMIGLAVIAWGLRRLFTGGVRPRSALHLPLAACAVVGLVSALQGLFPAVGVKAWIVAAGYAAFGYLYVIATPWTPSRRERWIRLASLLVFLVGLYGTLRMLMLGVGPRAAYGGARPFFVEHGTYSAFLGLLLPIPLFEAMERRGSARAWFAVAATAGFLGVAFSFTRAAWVASAVAIPASLVAWASGRRSFRRLIVPAAIASVLVLALTVQGVTGSFLRHAGTVTDTENVSNLERLNRWTAALQMAKAHPVLGVGYGGYPDAYRGYRTKAIVTQEVYGHYGAHSEPLRLLSEMGLVGLALGAWFFLAALVAGWRGFRMAPDPGAGRLALAAAAGLATYGVHALFNSYLGVDKVSVPFWLMIGLAAAMGSRSATGPTGRLPAAAR